MQASRKFPAVGYRVRNGFGTAALALFLGAAGCKSLPTQFSEKGAHSTTDASAEPTPAVIPAAWNGPLPEKLSDAAANGATPAAPIDLDAALRQAGAINPTIALAEETVQASLAERLQARSLLLPMLSAGANVHVHRGNLLTGEGAVRSSDSQSLYGGFGADVKGGGTVLVPGVRLISPLADALYAPQIAERKVVNVSFAAVAVRQQILLDVGRAYLALAGTQARRDALRQSQKEFDEIARLTANFAAKGQGRDADAQRAQAEALLLSAENERAQEEAATAAAELARLLDADPAVRLQAEAGVPPLLELIDAERSLDDLLAQAQAQHPQLAAEDAAVAVQQSRLRQERVRPWLPVVSVGFSAGQFGGGSQAAEPHLGNFSARTDFDVLAVWTLSNLGAGNRAVQQRVRAEMAQAEAERQLVLDRIRREATDAYALVQSRRRELELARKRIDNSQRAYREDLTRTQNLQGRVIEVLNSAQTLAAARQELIRATVAYSQAQMALAVAVGNSLAP